ncbi:MAG TPA: CBS domain-containing protein [Verrucomicrobiae bacterium]|jgi:CBS domain-containing protein|nr:CBS domain-containing protein [Verrucomicrobiae bacterium]
MTLKDILGVKGNAVWTVSKSQTVREAVELLVGRNIGALVVLDGNARVAGIISERDILRGGHENGEGFQDLPVSRLMTRKVIVGRPEDDIQTIMNVMTHSRIRHVPVMKDGALQGIVSIGDIVKSLLQDSEDQIQTLKEFIYGPVM